MLYIVGTPIGNLQDITLRAIETLKKADIILAEDTRRTKILLNHYGIAVDTSDVSRRRNTTSDVKGGKRLVSFHEHSSPEKIDWVVREFNSGKDIALVTDAGTPGVADPGGRLIEAILNTDGILNSSLRIIPIPGVSALTTILSSSGVQNEPCLFLGYLPKKKGRETLLNLLKELTGTTPEVDKNTSGVRSKTPKGIIKTIVLFESPQRIQKTLNDLQETFGPDTKLVIGRELTKQFEEISWPTLEEAINRQWPTRGEYTLLIGVG